MVPDGWNSIVRRLKKELPPPFPVTVQTVDAIKADMYGYTEFDGERLRIVIERKCLKCGCDCMFWVLLHEWLHAMDHWHLDRNDHPDSAGAYYMQAYRIIFAIKE